MVDTFRKSYRDLGSCEFAWRILRNLRLVQMGGDIFEPGGIFSEYFCERPFCFVLIRVFNRHFKIRGHGFLSST